jgi:CPA2 family monovalent cation:H+ antiporter-2
LTILGLTILVAGLAESIEVSAAVGALLVGIVLSGPAAHAAESLLAPLRDLFAALFFAFLGLSIDASTLVDALLPALGLAVVTGATKFFSTWLSAGSSGLPAPARIRAAAILVTRGEFSIVVAGLGVAEGIEPDLGALGVAYVLIMVIAGPLLVRFIPRGVRSPQPKSSEQGSQG